MIIQILQMKKFILIINQDPGRCTLNIMIHITIHPIIFLTTHIPMFLGMDIIGMLIGVKAGKIGKILERHHGFKGSQAVASWQRNRLDCFVRGDNNQMWHKWWNGSRWSNWEELGAPRNGVRSSPAAVSWGPNRIDCFVRGSNDRLWHKWCSYIYQFI
jgi:hypothetical protein